MTAIHDPNYGMRPEVELLLGCARVHIDSARVARISALLQEDLNWNYLLRMASQHGMMPLLYWHLKSIHPDAVPKATLDQLHGHFYNNARYNLLLTGALLKLLKLLETHKIPAIPYKGPALAVSVYGNLALRQFGDLDIVIRKQDILKVKDLLLSEGYRAEYQLTPAQETAFLQMGHAYSFSRQANAVHVEIHYQIFPSYLAFPLDLDVLWERLEPLSLAGNTVLNLAPGDLLLILCVHGAKHQWERLEWICGIAEMLRIHQGMDWNRIMQQATLVSNKRALLLGLLLASNLLDAPVPPQVLQEAQGDSVVKMLAAQVQARLPEESHRLAKNGELSELARSLLFYFRLRASLSDRIGYVVRCFQLLATPSVSDWTLIPLPDPLFPLYYLIRPSRQVGKHGRALLRIVQQAPGWLRYRLCPPDKRP